MKKIFLTTILTLMSIMGAWAKDYAGDVIMGFEPAVGDRIFLNCRVSSGSGIETIHVNYTDDKVSFSQNHTSDWVPINYLNNLEYADYVALNGVSSIDYIAVTKVSKTTTGSLNKTTTYSITGHLSGFYTKTEMAEALQTAYDAATNKGITAEQLTTYKSNILNAAIADARAIYDEACVKLSLGNEKVAALAEIETALGDITDATLLATLDNYKAQIYDATTVETINTLRDEAIAAIEAYKIQCQLAEAKEAAIAEINTALGDIADATLLATIQSYKDQINAATVIEAINPIKVDALKAIADYKAEQERLRLLAEAKEAAIAAIQALVSGSTDELAISTANKYIAAIEAATVIKDVAPLRSEAESVITSLLTEPDAFEFGFIGTGNPIETQHALEGVKMTYSEDGEDMTVTINGAEVTYPLSQVSGLTHFRGTPTVSLHANEDPDHAGNFYTTFYSGLEAYTLPEGVKAYTAEVEDSGNETVVRLATVTGNILPQGEAVLLYSDELQDGNWTMEVADPSAASASTANQFCGVDAQTAQADYGTYNYYMLSYGQNNLAFYKMNSSMMLSANKAFIAQSPSTPAQAMCMVFDDGNITSIASPHGDTGEGAAIYNLSGIRLNQLQKGINIVNGKKIIVK